MFLLLLLVCISIRYIDFTIYNPYLLLCTFTTSFKLYPLHYIVTSGFTVQSLHCISKYNSNHFLMTYKHNSAFRRWDFLCKWKIGGGVDPFRGDRNFQGNQNWHNTSHNWQAGGEENYPDWWGWRHLAIEKNRRIFDHEFCSSPLVSPMSPIQWSQIQSEERVN